MNDKLHRIRYPWKRWFSQKKTTLVQGKHFQCQIHSMAQQIRNTAPKYGVIASLRIEDDTIVARFHQKEEK
jgi:hypothetical protein